MSFKGRLNTDTWPRNFWTTFLENDLTEKLKKSAVASAIAIPLTMCFSYFVLILRFQENLTKPCYFYLSRTCGSPSGTPSVINLALKSVSGSNLRYILKLIFVEFLSSAITFFRMPSATFLRNRLPSAGVHNFRCPGQSLYISRCLCRSLYNVRCLGRSLHSLRRPGWSLHSFRRQGWLLHSFLGLGRSFHSFLHAITS